MKQELIKAAVFLTMPFAVAAMFAVAFVVLVVAWLSIPFWSTDSRGNICFFNKD